MPAFAADVGQRKASTKSACAPHHAFISTRASIHEVDGEEF